MGGCDRLYVRRVIDVILPVLNEAAALPQVIASLPFGYRPIVVDNGSTDGSARVATDHGAQVVYEPVPGFGAACFAGLEAASSAVVAFMDADGSLHGGDLPRVCEPVEDGQADLVLGARVARPGAWPLHARVANKALAFRLRRRGLRVTDLGPMRAAHRVALLDLAIADRRSGWPLEMVVRAHNAGWRVDEVRVPYRPRIGKSKVTGTIGGTVRAIKDMSAVLR